MSYTMLKWKRIVRREKCPGEYIRGMYGSCFTIPSCIVSTAITTNVTVVRFRKLLILKAHANGLKGDRVCYGKEWTVRDT